MLRWDFPGKAGKAPQMLTGYSIWGIVGLAYSKGTLSTRERLQVSSSVSRLSV